MAQGASHHNLIRGARVYLSGPMDFVPSRTNEKKYGWRRRVGQFLRSFGSTVFDPWYKPLTKGIGLYGEEDEKSDLIRKSWTFEPGAIGAKERSRSASIFWKTLHIDLRMVDLSDFIVACCPTNLYSVGTPHEIILARQQKKPVLFVSPPVDYPAFNDLKQRAIADPELRRSLDSLINEVPIKENPRGTPSLWYMALIGSENFFDGFGFSKYRKRFGWQTNVFDEREKNSPPRRPLLPFLEGLVNGQFPKRWNQREHKFTRDDDWLLLDLRKPDY